MDCNLNNVRYHSENFRLSQYIKGKHFFPDIPNDYEYIGCERLGVKLTKEKGISSSLSVQKDFTDKSRTLNDNELSDYATVYLLMNGNNLEEINCPLLQELKKYEYGYRKVMEEFSMTLNKWLKLRKGTINTIQKSEQKFRLIHRTTTSITLISSTVELATSVVLILKGLFHFSFGTRLPLLIVPVLGGISITSSLLALSYSKTSLEDIFKGLRDEKRLHRDLEVIHRKGNWIDKAVQDLFPFGIDLNILKETVLNVKGNLTDEKSWKHHVCSAIVQTNIKEDRKMLENENFLSRVKAFVESPTAQIWLNWMKLRKLLDEMSSVCENISEKELISGREVFLSRAAINLYPIFFPLFVKTGNTEKLRFLSNSITAVITAMDLADNETEEFQEMRKTSLNLKEDYKKIKRMSEDLITDYD